MLTDGLGESPSSSDLIGPTSEIRRTVHGQQGEGQLGGCRIIKKLGEGAMGIVYKAYQPAFARKVAVKTLFPHIAANPKLLERFYREARVAGRLDHPNLVCGYEVGEDNGTHYFIMEYVPSKTLQKVLTTLGRLTVPDALYIVLRVARGLQYAHDLGLVHRDVKPDNILITRKGEVKLADLGMVKNLDEEMDLTQTGHAVGTPWYMPLEQARNAKDADGRCDIYALGCVLYALLTGQPPFAGQTLIEVIQAKERGTFPPARKANSEVPAKLDLIIHKMTAKQPQHRYATCAEVIRDLESLGLAGSELYFLAAARGEAAPQPVAAPEPVASSRRTPMPRRAEEPPADVWYLRYETAEGQPVQRKLTHAELLELIKAGDFDPEAQASRSPAEGYRALATFRELEPLVLGRVAKSAADRQAAHYRKLYKQIEEEDERKRERPEAPPPLVAPYWVGVALRVGGVAAAVGAVLLVLRWLIALVGP
jgi:serine/threonine-protein kinase